MADEEGFLPGENNIFGDLNRLSSMLADMDERALVLSIAAFAEEALRDLIKATSCLGTPPTRCWRASMRHWVLFLRGLGWRRHWAC